MCGASHQSEVLLHTSSGYDQVYAGSALLDEFEPNSCANVPHRNQKYGFISLV